MSINTSDYNRVGIFIEERNQSAIDRAPAQEAVINFIPGFSRKGTVFNRPILIKTKNDRNAYFGEIDRYLEKKGSFFHRTIEVALQTAPVWAMNLLKTNSLDTLNYASVSVSAQYDNAPVADRQYDDFFNKAGFWQRDTESFLDFAQNSERMIHFTNLSDKKISVFMFKSSKPGFDVTAETWYGGKDKVPTWLNYNDLMSDYMVRVVVVAGDWSNYIPLAADPNWSKYFAASGLRKDKVDGFIRDNGVSLLGDYTGSLIPYFRDNNNNNNIFIETLINLDTDRTGLFCAYDIDNVETDFPNGNVDIIGQTLVDNEKAKINFMSYQDTIEDVDAYEETQLDALGNVIGIGSGITGLGGTRLNNNTNGNITGLTFATGLVGGASSKLFTSASGEAIINNTVLSLVNTTLNFSALPTPTATTIYRIDTVYISPTGVITLLEGAAIELANSLTESAAVTAGLTYPSSYPNGSIILGYYFRSLDTTGPTYVNTYVSVSHSGAAYVDLNIGSAGTDVLVANTATTTLTMTFVDTAAATKANYKAWRRLQFFNELITKKVLSTSIIIGQTTDFVPVVGIKIALDSATWTDNFTGAGDKYVTITVTTGDIKTQSYTNGKFIFNYVDNEFIMGTKGLETRYNESLATTDYGVVAKNSEFYQDYYNGMINTSDYFYRKIADTTSIKFVHYTNLLFPNSVGDYIIMSNADALALGLSVGSNNLNILIDQHPINTGNYTVNDGEDNLGVVFAPGLVSDGYLGAGEIAFAVNNLVSTYVIPQTISIYDYDAKAYLKMYTLSDILKVDFKAENTLTTDFIITNLGANMTIRVYSGEASYEQTLEIETHPSYTITDFKFLIDSTRYPEVKVGDYVKAYIDTPSLEPSEYPKKFARILKKIPWSGNATYNVSYSEISVDVKYDVQSYNGGADLQTTRYTRIEDYIDTYKAITMKGFTVQATSIPDGTEARQLQILDIVGKETPLYNAIVNKNTFNFRYLIDSFGLGLTESSKQQLADITGKRKNCIGILNMPSAKAFKNSSSPYFVNEDGTLNTEYIKLGGNPELNPPFLYTLAQGSGKDDGRDTVGYFFPYVTVNDNGRPLNHPPAAFIANTYMRKIGSTIAGTYNWTVAAGSVDGRVLGISGTEMDFTEFDYEQLYAMGVNPLSYAKNIGYYIETEFTAATDTLSALSFLHVREILIDLENELYAMLFKYQWKFNTAAVRAKIKREADDICQKYVDKSALYAFTNVIDESNNTPQIIDNQFGLLETYIEPVKAMGTIVNVINVMATGALGTSTGFN